MFNRTTFLSLLLSVPCLFLTACGGGVEEAAKPDYSLDFRCQNCKHEFSHEWDEIQKMKESGAVVIPEGELMQVTCPECGEMKGTDADVRAPR